MKQNVGGFDRVLRLVFGAALIAYGYIKMIWWVELIGAIVFLTGLIGWCGLYTLLGINTAKKAQKTTGKKSKKKK
jgi:heme O synthase-like polyprenyltransferase